MKRVIHKVFNAVGYEIHRTPLDPEPTIHPASAVLPERADPFLQQKILLDGVNQPVIFDVGANVGTVTRRYRLLFPNATIYAFEPFPKSFEKLRESCAIDSGAHPHQVGFAERSGTAPFNVNVDDMTNSLFSTDAAAASFWGRIVDTTQQIQVEITTLDEFCEQNNIDHIDILKIDTQGAEGLVLRGASRMLEEKNISYIYAELILVPTYRGQTKFHEVVSYLDEHGYSIFSIYNFDYRPGSNRLLQVDAIFFAENGKAVHREA